MRSNPAESRSRHFGFASVILITAGLALPVACSGADSPGSPGRGAALFGSCTPCHGPTGGGRQDLGAPAIAGQQEWYLKLQLENFKNGLRGGHPDDAAGLRMRPMARTLETDADVAAVSAYVAKLPPVATAKTVEGDVAKGEVTYKLCVNCHGPKAEGIETQKAPSLFMTGDWYQLEQLKKYKAGIRGANPKNSYGLVMRGFAMGLADEQVMKDVVAYIQTLATTGGQE